MNAFAKFALALAGSLLFATALAQDIRDDEADVLLTIEREWEANRKGDEDAVEEMLADDFMGWSKSSPAPRSKNSTLKWMRLSQEVGKVMRFELYPLWVTVHENVAVAHYAYSTAVKKKDGDIEMHSGRYTDILVRSDGGWKFLAWHGGRDD